MNRRDTQQRGVGGSSIETVAIPSKKNLAPFLYSEAVYLVRESVMSLSFVEPHKRNKREKPDRPDQPDPRHVPGKGAWPCSSQTLS